MAYLNDEALDQGLAWVISTGTQLSLCSSEPPDYASIAAAELAAAAVTVTGPTNGDTSGRKVTVPAVSDDDVDTTGTGTHVALHNGSDTLVATIALSASINVDASGTYSLSAWDIEIADATAE